MKRQHKDYEPPRLTVVSFAAEQGFQGTVSPQMLSSWGAATGSSGDPWGDGVQPPSSGTRFGGGWSDAGGDAWN